VSIKSFIITIIIIINGCTALCWTLAPFFNFLILYTVGRTLSTGNQPVARQYLHTEQHKNRVDAHRHLFLEWNSNPRPQCLSGRNQFMPQTARPATVIGFLILLCSFIRKCRIIDFLSVHQELCFWILSSQECHINIYQTTRSLITEDSILHSYSRENI
jgi:hypothetical protein